MSGSVRKCLPIFYLAGAVFFSMPAEADSHLEEGSVVKLEMKNGQTVQGKVTTSKNTFCTLEKEDGTMEVITLTEVAKSELLEAAKSDLSSAEETPEAPAESPPSFEGPMDLIPKNHLFRIKLLKGWKATDASGQLSIQGPAKESQIVIKYQYSEMANRPLEQQKKALNGMAMLSGGLMQMALKMTLKNQGETAVDSVYAYRTEFSYQQAGTPGELSTVTLYFFRAGP